MNQQCINKQGNKPYQWCFVDEKPSSSLGTENDELEMQFFSACRSRTKYDYDVSKDRWNQVGGAELLSLENHEYGCNILFADGRVKYEIAKELPKLRWQIDETGFVFPTNVVMSQVKAETYRMALVTPINIIIIIVAFTIAYIFKIWQSWRLSMIIGIISAVLGVLFGAIAELVYISSEFKYLGLWEGLVLGLLSGACFATFLVHTSRNLRSDKKAEYSLATGLCAGIICLTLLNLILVYTHSKVLQFVITGIPYGIIFGAVMGYIAGKLLPKLAPAKTD